MAPIRTISTCLTALLAALILVSGPARSEPVRLVPPDAWEVIHTARAFGPAEVGQDAMKDPLITGTIDGLAYEIAFYGCWLGRKCESVLFHAQLARKDWKPQAKLLKEWNREKLVGRAWIDDKTTAVLDHAVAMGPGLPEETLKLVFASWRTALAEYAEHLDFPRETR